MDTLTFARHELSTYLDKMSPGTSFGMDVRVASDVYETPDADPLFDDAYRIEAEGTDIKITGVNPRSTLFGVYDFLKTLGADFSVPGHEHERWPEIDGADIHVKKHVVPDRRHRVICLEGAVSHDHVLGLVDWAAKNGFNGYFIQFTSGYEFFERWYAHKRNPLRTPGKPFTAERADDIKSSVLDAVKTRGLVYHEMGHGWTNLALGLPISGWHEKEITAVDEDKRAWLAQINGKRGFYKDIPLNTQLCYGNPDVREAMSDAVVTYARNHPEVDVLHVWLADDFNNHCECELCRGHEPVDDYIRILNLIDRKLTDAGLDVKIAFLVYFELRWPSQSETIVHPSRFIMMYAPITRTYTRSYADVDVDDLPPMRPYQRNDNTFGDSLEENLAFLDAWKNVFDGDSFLFDYHLMWDGFKDVAQWRLSEVLHRDIRFLDRLGLNGLISCQLQRNFFPTPLAMRTMGRTLMDRTTDLDGLKEDVCRSVDPDHPDRLRSYMDRMSHIDFFRLMRGETALDDEMVTVLMELRQTSRDFRTYLGKGDTIHEPERSLLVFMNDLYEKIIDVMMIIREQRPGEEEIKALHDRRVRPFIFKAEEKHHALFDGYYADHVIRESLVRLAEGE